MNFSSLTPLFNELFRDFFVKINRASKRRDYLVKMKRTKERIIQGCDVYIGRRLNMGEWKLEQSKWANPFKVPKDGNLSEVLRKYKEYVLKNEDLMKSLPELKDKVLGCWCKPNKCHGDVLLELLHNGG